ncbi:WD repeat-containing rrt2 [Hyphodiscus hymeniophilus]|uniref:methylated diphthine methylhydrolase n=1 Tax=Hyphodiscus hymeniophilus TaxID=353542 RepID=A0A9P6VFU2_9HELO|nr:WD repeat-containing rrt2 [Hyphodiscus hymeniophilus]
MDPSKFSKAVQPLDSTILDLPPSCIEFIPGFPDFFVVGTYNLQKEVDTGSLHQSRTGSLNLLPSKQDLTSLRTLVQTISHPSAILDLHFLTTRTEFGVVSSTGTISIYKFQAENHSITHLTTHQAFDSAILVLSFTWHPFASLQSRPVLAATLSNGSLHLLRFSTDLKDLETMNDSDPLNTHDLEAWTCAFVQIPESESGLRIYSGGDDGVLRLTELESLPLNSESEIPVLHKFKCHEAGVTAILPISYSKNPDHNGALNDLLLTGSYDDHVRVYNAKNPRGKVLAELKIGGGVWRLKLLDPLSPGKLNDSDGVRFRVLASCMHAGARILEVTRAGRDGEWKIEILGSVTVHESMCYGSDVQPVGDDSGDQDERRICVSTSFYDRLVCLWRFDPNAV